MSDPYNGWTSFYSLIVLHPHASSVLMQERQDGYALPCVRVEDFCWYRRIGEASSFVEREMGAGWRLLRCVSCLDDPEARVSRRVYLACNPGQLHLEGIWVDRSELADLTLSTPRHRSMIRGCLEDADGQTAHGRPEWTLPGWLEQAEAWFGSQLTELGCEYVRIENEYGWPLAAVLRARTDSGDVYMKACSMLPDRVDEPLLTARLAGLFPDFVPSPLVVDPDRRWMLLPDLGHPIRNASEDQKHEALMVFGRLQLQAVEKVDELLQLGCPDRRLGGLAADIKTLTRMDAGLSGLGADELIRLRAAEPGLIEIARKLASYKVPFTLCHGDMHLGNVALCDGRYAFFDWGEGCVSHPFLDAVHFAHESEFESFPEEEYCALWSAYETAERLREALSLARPLCSLIETMSQYHACVHLRPEPEEFPECLTAGLQTLMAEATA